MWKKWQTSEKKSQANEKQWNKSNKLAKKSDKKWEISEKKSQAKKNSEKKSQTSGKNTQKV